MSGGRGMVEVREGGGRSFDEGVGYGADADPPDDYHTDACDLAGSSGVLYKKDLYIRI